MSNGDRVTYQADDGQWYTATQRVEPAWLGSGVTYHAIDGPFPTQEFAEAAEFRAREDARRVVRATPPEERERVLAEYRADLANLEALPAEEKAREALPSYRAIVRALEVL